MQSRLPVRIKRKNSDSGKKQCCCSQLWKLVIDQPNEAGDKSTATKGVYEYLVNVLAIKKDLMSKITQTDMQEEFEKIPYSEIKTILLSINNTLENILQTLQEKKEFLYSKLEDEGGPTTPMKKNKPHSKKEIKKSKMALQIARKITFTWPEISRLNYNQSLIPKPYMQKFFHGPPNSLSTASNLIICPKRSTFQCRPFSCSDINYFQPMGKIIQRRALGIMYPTPILTLINPRQEVKKNDESVNESSSKKRLMLLDL